MASVDRVATGFSTTFIGYTHYEKFKCTVRFNAR